ncbi:MAG TPA: type II secretion system protein GspM [Verrucomicrobiae bacterium]|nr:type II secretion system protein GspM [Verrucomicrobiae bacterium]
MTQWVRDLMDRFDRLSLRERGVVLIMLVLLLVLTWDSALMGPLERKRKTALQQVQALRAEVSGLEQSVETIVAQMAANPQSRSKNSADTLLKEIAGLDAQLAGATSGLIAPREMGQVLEQLLARTSSMRLQGLKTLPPEPVVAPSAEIGLAPGAPPAANGPASQAPATKIFKHGVELQLSGSYLEALQFLKAVEKLPWRFFWDQVEFTVEEHPQGRMKLTLYTLSLQEGWIGV